MITDQVIEKIPTWVCGRCKSKNKYIINPQLLFKNEDEVERVYIKGKCRNCSKSKIEKKETLKNFLPDKLQKITIESLTGRDDKFKRAAEIMSRINKADRWIYIEGAANTGKTYLMSASVNNLLSIGIKCYYFSAIDYFDNNDGDSNQKINSSRVIYIDDFGIIDVAGYSWKKEKLYQLINRLDLNGKIVVFASPFNLDRIAKRYGASIHSKILRNDIYEIQLTKKFQLGRKG